MLSCIPDFVRGKTIVTKIMGVSEGEGVFLEPNVRVVGCKLCPPTAPGINTEVAGNPFYLGLLMPSTQGQFDNLMDDLCVWFMV